MATDEEILQEWENANKAQADTTSALTDVLNSVYSGGSRGIGSTLGFLGDAGRFALRNNPFDMSGAGVSFTNEIDPDYKFGDYSAAGADTFEKGLSPSMELYKPETNAGQYAKAIGDFGTSGVMGTGLLSLGSKAAKP